MTFYLSVCYQDNANITARIFMKAMRRWILGQLGSRFFHLLIIEQFFKKPTFLSVGMGFSTHALV